MKTLTSIGIQKIGQRFVDSVDHADYTLNGVPQTAEPFRRFVQGASARVYIYFDDTVIGDVAEVQLVDKDGDIITDEAAEIQGGVGTAGSANIGKRYAMFEAIHGSAPRMVQEGRAKYADPSSVLRAAVMLLEHIGEIELAKKLDRALDICMVEERKVVVTGRDTGATAQEFTDYVLDTIAKL